MDMSRWIMISGAAILALGVWACVSITSIGGPGGGGIAPLVGEPFSTKNFTCHGEWKFEPQRQIYHCEDVRLSSPLFSGDPVRMEVHLDEKTDGVSFVALIINSWTPKVAATGDERRLLTWAETLTEALDLSDCEAIYSPYHDSGLWSCDRFSYGHTGVYFDEVGQPQARLWIGGSVDDFEAAFHTQGRREHRLRARRSMEVGLEYLENEQIAAADRKFLMAYYQLSLITPPQRIPEDDHHMERLADFRDVLRAPATEEREKYRSHKPLAHHRGDIDRVHLTGQDFGSVRVLLGPPQECAFVGVGRSQVCTYGDKSWTIQIGFVEEKAIRVVVNRSALIW